MRVRREELRLLECDRVYIEGADAKGKFTSSHSPYSTTLAVSKRTSLTPRTQSPTSTPVNMAAARLVDDVQDTSDAESDSRLLGQTIEERGDSPGAVDTPDRDDSEVSCYTVYA